MYLPPLNTHTTLWIAEKGLDPSEKGFDQLIVTGLIFEGVLIHYLIGYLILWITEKGLDPLIPTGPIFEGVLSGRCRQS